MRAYLRNAGLEPSELKDVERFYDQVLSLVRAAVPLGEARVRLDEEGHPAALRGLELPLLPESDAEWELLTALIDYDPRPALERIAVPVLVFFGAEDPVTPVDESVAVFRQAVRPDLLRVEVFPGAGHRLETGDPPRLAGGYLEALTSFVLGRF